MSYSSRLVRMTCALSVIVLLVPFPLLVAYADDALPSGEAVVPGTDAPLADPETPSAEEPLDDVPAAGDEKSSSAEPSAETQSVPDEGGEQGGAPEDEFILDEGARASGSEEDSRDGDPGRVSGRAPTVRSGDAIVLANVLNIVNTSLVNSEGNIIFRNITDPGFGTLDLRTHGSSSPLGACGLLLCGDSDGVDVIVRSNAYIDNDVHLLATSGGNKIVHAGDAEIDTGNAYAGLNLVNIANTTLVDSNYLLLTLNAFVDVNGDIVFPALGAWGGGGGYGGSVDTANAAAVSNGVSVTADSGGNETDADASLIATGDARATSNIFNQLNSTLIGGTSVSILLRVGGEWAGEVFGAPEGLSWTTSDDGHVYVFGTPLPEGGVAGAPGADVSARNRARISNDVSVAALSGDNKIRDAESALITTGDALAGLNLVNIANATVVGRNWVLAIINIFGDFNGNIAFGRPDLWIGAQADVPSALRSGDEVAYTFTILNNGDSPATGVALESTVPDFLAEFNSPFGFTVADGVLSWDLPDLPPGGATEVTLTARVSGAGEGTDITSVVSVGERETDENLSDNSDTVTVRTYTTPRGGGNYIPWYGTPRILKAASRIDAERSVPEAVAFGNGVPIREEIVIRNDDWRPQTGLVVSDTLRDPSGAVVHTESWDLGEIGVGERITLGYSISFDAEAVPGTYTLSTSVHTNEFEEGVFSDNGRIDLRAGRDPSPDFSFLPSSDEAVWWSAGAVQGAPGGSFPAEGAASFEVTEDASGEVWAETEEYGMPTSTALVAGAGSAVSSRDGIITALIIGVFSLVALFALVRTRERWEAEEALRSAATYHR